MAAGTFSLLWQKLKLYRVLTRMRREAELDTWRALQEVRIVPFADDDFNNIPAAGTIPSHGTIIPGWLHNNDPSGAWGILGPLPLAPALPSSILTGTTDRMPVDGPVGQLFYDTQQAKIFVWNGTVWDALVLNNADGVPASSPLPAAPPPPEPEPTEPPPLKRKFDL